MDGGRLQTLVITEFMMMMMEMMTKMVVIRMVISQATRDRISVYRTATTSFYQKLYH